MIPSIDFLMGKGLPWSARDVQWLGADMASGKTLHRVSRTIRLTGLRPKRVFSKVIM